MEDQAMRIANRFLLALVAFTTLPLLAQQSSTRAHQSASAAAAGSQIGSQVSESSGAAAQASPGSARVEGSSSATAASQAGDLAAAKTSESDAASAATGMRPVSGELVGKLDAKSAKAGDLVVVKTTEAVKTADGTTIPKGSRLVGEVTDVQAHGSASEDSHVAIKFYRAELKGGESLAIHCEIQSVSRPASAMAAGSMDEDSFGGMGGGMGMSGGGRAMGGGRVGSGLGGASLRSVAQTTSRTNEHVGEHVGTAAGGTGRATAHVAGNAASSAGGRVRASGGAVGSAGGRATAHATGVPGVMLQSRGTTSGLASGTLSASKKNVHLDSGTQMVLGVSGAGAR